MLFSSAPFLVYFLPAVFAGFLALSAFGSRRATIAWLTLASFVFYGWARPEGLVLLLGSIGFNYLVAGELMKQPRKPLLAGAIVINVGLLAYYKYAGFGIGIADALSGKHWAPPAIVLPLAISFLTFRQIAYLIDASHGELTNRSLLDYCLFISFFPQLVAGPITLQREMLPQFSDRDRAVPRWDDIAVGTTLFLIGLFKKVMIADRFGVYTSPIFEAARHQSMQLMEAWSGAVAYALQIYFDFSGYSDMAVGLALLFGIALPINFNSPYKATNMMDYWSRWHMTLTRFLTGYIYTPVAAALSRRRAAAGKPIMSGGVMNARAFAQLVIFPTMLTMLVSGVWHGAGWQFVIFGLLHGTYIVAAHAWRRYKKMKNMPMEGGKLATAGSVLATFVCAAIALVFFRAADVRSALSIVSGMAGLNGATLPKPFHAIPFVGRASAALGIHIAPVALVDPSLGAMIAFFLFIVWAMPNAYQWLSEHPAILTFKVKEPDAAGPFAGLLLWQPRIATGVIVGVIGALTLLRSFSAVPTEFIYAQF